MPDLERRAVLLRNLGEMPGKNGCTHAYCRGIGGPCAAAIEAQTAAVKGDYSPQEGIGDCLQSDIVVQVQEVLKDLSQ